MKLIDEIWKAVEDGVLGSEQCPDPDYWHWPVKEPKKLSDRLAAIYIVYGEVRWYPSYE